MAARPSVVQWWIVGLTAAALCSGCVADLSNEAPPGYMGTCGTEVERDELVLTNEARTSMGLVALQCDLILTEVARAHSQDMCDQRYFDHTALDGRSPFDRMRDGGAMFGAAGENIARGQPDPPSVHDAWMNSPGHRANILNDRFLRIGIGHVPCPGYGPVWTQNFSD